MFSHGTLLFDTDLEKMLKAINPRQVKIESKAVQSVRNFVANIRELLPVDMDIQTLKGAILRGVFKMADIPTYNLSESDWEQIRTIAATRYQSWEWNIGRSPHFNVQKSERFPVGKLDVRIDVDKGRIQAAKIYGDFAGRRDVAGLEAQLTGLRYDPDALAAALEDVDIEPYFGKLPKADFLALIY